MQNSNNFQYKFINGFFIKNIDLKSNNSIYEGEYKNKIPNGQGIEKYSNGKLCYYGEFKDGKYNGILCAIPAHEGCSTETSLDIKAQMVIVMSGDTPYICINSSVDNGTVTTAGLTTYNAISRQFCQNTEDDLDVTKQHRDNDNKLILGFKQSGTVSITMADLHNQPMPAGTTVSFKSSVGSVTSGPSDWEGNKNGGSMFSATIKAGDEAESGTLDVILTFEDGGTVTLHVADVIIN